MRKKIIKRFFFVALTLTFVTAAAPAEAFWPFDRPAVRKTATSVPQAPLEKPVFTLAEAYTLSLARSETVAIEESDLGLAQARFYRAFKYFLPNVSWQTTRTERDVERSNSSSSGGVGADFQRRVTPEDKFVFSQPLFSGFREFAALAGSGADKSQQRLEYERAKELLVVDVVDAFCAALQSDRDVEILRSIHRLLAERAKDLSERVKLGRSRESEGKVSLADLKLVEADLVGARSAAKAARNLLEFYTGTDLTGRSFAEITSIAAPGELAEHLPKADRRRDVLAAKEAAKVASNAITSAQAGFLPSASLDGNYYTRRVGFSEGNDWDVTLKLSVPIFDAGETLGDVKEAWTLRKVADLRLRQTRKTAELEIRNAFEDYRSAIAEREALVSASQASRANYDLLTKEYSYSLVNNLEVLDALRRYEDIERRRNISEYETQRSYARFRAATGEALV
jgi:outer membrane protein TolC